jgi:hypothetical protein
MLAIEKKITYHFLEGSAMDDIDILETEPPGEDKPPSMPPRTGSFLAG